ncbi:hypothetical protein D1BOALGB6SA_2822 [Olavius sp. associated proteobacterium Delta 1]|nr:hypothetical protein D1BOALGB6SA_2822 [Olavius sp. associated proteobacterium Delta 1]
MVFSSAIRQPVIIRDIFAAKKLQLIKRILMKDFKRYLMSNNWL